MQTQKAGRGGLAVAFAKIYFILLGFVQQIVLRRVLGLDGYGALSTVLSVSSISYNPVTQASIQSVSREISSAEPAQRTLVLRRVLGVHLGLALALTLVFVASAGIVSKTLGAPHIEGALTIFGAVLFVYGVYTPLVGALNGEKRFVPQASLDVLSATLRTAGLIFGAYFGLKKIEAGRTFGMEGAALGGALAALAMFLVAFAWVGLGRTGGSHPRYSSYLKVLLWLLTGQALLNLLFQADALLLRRFAADWMLAQGRPMVQADPLVGAYRAAQLFGFLPYQLMMSVTFILFPMLSEARAQGQAERVKAYVEGGVRLAAVLSGLMVTALVAAPHGLIGLVYGADAAALSGDALRILAIGLGFFAVFGVMSAAQNSLGGERTTLFVTLSALGLVTGACFLLAKGAPSETLLLIRTATATSLGLILATLLIGISLRRRAGGVVPWLSLIRVLGALALAGTLGAQVPGAGLVSTALRVLLSTGSYLALLIAARELGPKDLQRLQVVVGRERK